MESPEAVLVNMIMSQLHALEQENDTLKGSVRELQAEEQEIETEV